MAPVLRAVVAMMVAAATAATISACRDLNSTATPPSPDARAAAALPAAATTAATASANTNAKGVVDATSQPGATPTETRNIPPWQPTTPATLTLLSAGRGPKAPLRYDIAPGTSQRATMAVQMDLAQSGGAMAARPTIVMEFTTVAGTPVEGGVSLTQTFDKVYATDRPGSVIPGAMATEQLQKINGLVVMGVLTPQGMLRGVGVTYPPALQESDVGPAQAMLRSVEKLVPQLPTEPVGVGAAWNLVERMRQDGVDVTSTTRVELKARRGDSATLIAKTTTTAPPQIVTRDGHPLEVKGISGTGATTFEIDLARPIPHVVQTLDMNIDLAAQFTSKMKLTVTPE